MKKYQVLLAVCALAGAFACSSLAPARAADLSITPGVFFGNDSNGFGGNLSTDLAPLGSSATLRGAVTLATNNHSTSFGLGVDAVGHEQGVYYGAGANVFFPSCSGCNTTFSPDLLVGFKVAPTLSIEARYYIATQNHSNGLFFTGLQFKL